jgi:hypothetical protein
MQSKLFASTIAFLVEIHITQLILLFSISLARQASFLTHEN